MSYQNFKNAFVKCLLWSSATGNHEEPFNSWADETDLASEAMKEIETDCRGFYDHEYKHWSKDNAWTDERAGFDFCLTRNGHGAGFWDRGITDERPDGKPGNLGDYLSDACKPYGTLGLYKGDDGKLYTHN